MALTREQVQGLADLARLELSDAELAVAEQDLDNILGYVESLQGIDTQGVLPFSMPARTEWREDVALPCDHAAREIILSNFPERNGDLLKTPGVFEKPKGGKV
jgi:aspartyl-tRNA(Asn)/glutamyl-tRNA(Gln) amidotransferase subunit C